MTQAAKLIGLYYRNMVYYAMFIYVSAFDSPEEARILAEQAGISAARAGKLLLIAPIDRLGCGGEVAFCSMPGELQPREPYVLSDPFVRERWQEIQPGDILSTEAIVNGGMTGFAGNLDRYLFRKSREMS